MGETRDDFGLDVGLYVGPFLAGLGWSGGEEFFKVAGLDVGDYAAGGKGVVVADDCEVLVCGLDGEGIPTFINRGRSILFKLITVHVCVSYSRRQIGRAHV